jgi:uncharacterized protein (TIGR03083 family)
VDAETSWRVIEQERLSLAALLENLSDDQWNAPSLCEGWRVKDVAAHVALAAQPPSPLVMVVEGVRAHGRFHKINHDFSVRHAERPGADMIAELREHAASRRLPKVTNYRNILFDILVHGQDIAIPLGVQLPMRPELSAVAATRRWDTRNTWLATVNRRLPVNGYQLRATDVDWSRGQGADITGPIGAILLLLTGRPAALQQLTGEGAAALRATETPPPN